MRRPRSARVVMPVLLLSAAAALSLFAAALRARQGATKPGAVSEQVIYEQLDSVPEADPQATADAASILGATEPSVRASEQAVADEAADVVGAYGERSDCALARSGYLGLLGNSWSCLVYGGDWAEVCVVTATEGGGSEVRTWTITVEEVEDLADG